MLATKEQIGKLDRRITIQQKVFEGNEFNEDKIETWQTVAEVWANVRESEDGTELYEADKLTEIKHVKFTIRYRAMLPTYRIVYGGFEYDILNISEVSRKRFLVLKTEEKGVSVVIT